MGEIADMMIDGTLDYITGEYIGEGYGYPRTRQENSNKAQSKLNGIKKYLRKQGFNDSTKVINRYCKEVLNVSNNQMKHNLKSKCELIQQDFGKFVSHVKTLKNKK